MSVFEGGAPCETDLENIDSASVSDADTVQNTNAPSCHVEGVLNDNELLKGLLTDTFCQVCEAVLLFESQRVSHYEGKKHAQRVRIFLQTKKAEKNKQGQECGSFQGSKVNPERFCELCSMVFSSPVVAKSHYEGKVHAKNMKRSDPSPSAGKQCHTDVVTEDVRTTAGSVAPLVPAREETGVGTVDQEQKERTTSAAQEVDLSNPDKYCKLCTASFNNPHMAQQHYSGRKHQRNQARQEMISKLPKDSERVNTLTCPVCCVTLSSKETYQAHMQGNKHYVQEKKVVGLCKTQKKFYDSFQDELADYIQTQKARGLEPKAGPGSEALGQRKEEEGLNDSNQFEEEPKIPFPPPSHLPRHRPPPPPLLPPPPPPFCPPQWRTPFNPQTGHFGFRGRFPIQNQWGQGYPLHPSPPIPGPIGRPLHRGRSPDSFSSSTSSDSSSFSSSSSSDSSKDRRRRRRKGKERTKRRREQENDTEKDERRRSKKRQRREGEEEHGNAKKAKGQKRMSFEEEQETDEGNEWRKRKEKRYKDGDSSEEDDYRSKRGISKKRQRRKEGHHGKRQRGDDELSKESEGGSERGGGRGLSEGAQVMMEEHTEEKSEPKRKKEKKKSKEKTEGGDNRTEEEKLWDETILGIF